MGEGKWGRVGRVSGEGWGGVSGEGWGGLSGEGWGGEGWGG